MSLHNCIKCWQTPCECGYDWKDYNLDQLAEYIATTVKYKTKQEALEVMKKAEFIIHSTHKQSIDE